MQSPSPIITGLAMRCPQCGKGRLIRGFLTVEKQCAVCGLDLGAVDSGDGPAFFAIVLVGMIIAFGAAGVEIAYAPPVWVHVAVWPMATLLLSLLFLRLFKALLIAFQYKHKVKGLGE